MPLKSMKILGNILCLFAFIFLSNETKNLKQKLLRLQKKYTSEKHYYTSFLKSVLIIGEDHRYLYHSGVDPIALIRILWKRLYYQKKEGGSTIEQQLIRTITDRYEKTVKRKIIEMLLASTLFRYLSKSDIAGLYLMTAYFGWRLLGLKNVCKELNISYNTCNIEDAAKIISRLKYPQPKIYSEQKIFRIDNRVLYIKRRYNLLSQKFVLMDELI
jgi:membrane carboxypeptidase/penicillin-binding protein